MATWREIEEPTDENILAVCRLDFSANFGVPAAWTIPSAANDQQEEPEDVTP